MSRTLHLIGMKADRVLVDGKVPDPVAQLARETAVKCGMESFSFCLSSSRVDSALDEIVAREFDRNAQCMYLAMEEMAGEQSPDDPNADYFTQPATVGKTYRKQLQFIRGILSGN
ncbi:MAG: hypothetical protein GY776_16420 [Alteromonas sp.]|nr:hypothetical protein [Alteromonas sp.]